MVLASTKWPLHFEMVLSHFLEQIKLPYLIWKRIFRSFIWPKLLKYFWWNKPVMGWLYDSQNQPSYSSQRVTHSAASNQTSTFRNWPLEQSDLKLKGVQSELRRPGKQVDNRLITLDSAHEILICGDNLRKARRGSRPRVGVGPANSIQLEQNISDVPVPANILSLLTCDKSEPRSMWEGGPKTN